MADPDKFFGPDGLMPYFSAQLGPVAQTFFGKAFGVMLTSVAIMHFWDGPSDALVKYMAVSALLMLYPMVLAVMDGANFTGLFKPQIVVHLGLCYLLSKAAGLM